MIVMKEVDIKEELRILINREKDIHVLEAIKTLLSKSSLDPALKEKLSNRALKSEQDIKEDKVYSRQELEKKLDDRLRG